MHPSGGISGAVHPAAQGPQSIQQITLDAGNLNPAPIKTFNGIFTVYSPPVQGNTGVTP